jgi:hypothetical protein
VDGVGVGGAVNLPGWQVFFFKLLLAKPEFKSFGELASGYPHPA